LITKFNNERIVLHSKDSFKCILLYIFILLYFNHHVKMKRTWGRKMCCTRAIKITTSIFARKYYDQNNTERILSFVILTNRDCKILTNGRFVQINYLFVIFLKTYYLYLQLTERTFKRIKLICNFNVDKLESLTFFVLDLK